MNEYWEEYIVLRKDRNRRKQTELQGFLRTAMPLSLLLSRMTSDTHLVMKMSQIKFRAENRYRRLRQPFILAGKQI